MMVRKLEDAAENDFLIACSGCNVGPAGVKCRGMVSGQGRSRFRFVCNTHRMISCCIGVQKRSQWFLVVLEVVLEVSVVV